MSAQVVVADRIRTVLDNAGAELPDELVEDLAETIVQGVVGYLLRGGPAPKPHKAKPKTAAPESTQVELAEIRLGGRNYLRPGDPVRVKPSRPGKRDGFVGRVQRIVETRAEGVVVHVAGGPAGKNALHVYRLDRLQRVQRSKEVTR